MTEKKESVSCESASFFFCRGTDRRSCDAGMQRKSPPHQVQPHRRNSSLGRWVQSTLEAGEGRADPHAAFGHGRAVAGGRVPARGRVRRRGTWVPVSRAPDRPGAIRLDTSCSPEGGREGALGIIGDPQVAGVIGNKLLGRGRGGVARHQRRGLGHDFAEQTPRRGSPPTWPATRTPPITPVTFACRPTTSTRHAPLSDFVYNQRELRSVATVHDGDPLHVPPSWRRFADAFSALGGKVPAQAEIEKGDTDMTEVLEQFRGRRPGRHLLPAVRDGGIRPLPRRPGPSTGLKGRP